MAHTSKCNHKSHRYITVYLILYFMKAVMQFSDQNASLITNNVSTKVGCKAMGMYQETLNINYDSLKEVVWLVHNLQDFKLVLILGNGKSVRNTSMEDEKPMHANLVNCYENLNVQDTFYVNCPCNTKIPNGIHTCTTLKIHLLNNISRWSSRVIRAFNK